MRKRIKISLVFAWMGFNVFLIILPNMIFTDSLSKSVILEESLELPTNNHTIEEVLKKASELNLYSNDSGYNNQYLDSYAVEIQNLLKEINISSEYLVILDQKLKIDSETIYWRINYSTFEGYGEVLLEESTNKIVQFKYFPEQPFQEINPEQVLHAYFRYLNIELTSIEQKQPSFEVFLSDNTKIDAYIDEYQILINYPDD